VKKLIILRWVLFLMLLTAAAEPVAAQCAMCRRIAESNMEDGNKRGRGLNSGILYMMSIPYLLGGVGVVIWWKYRKAGQSSD
jgi:hypothetical protein